LSSTLQKTLTINIHQDPTKHVELFLQNWLQIGAYEQKSELEYELIGNTGKISLLSMTRDIITITGEIPSQSFMLIDSLVKACEGDRVIEGDVIDKNQTGQANFNSPFGQSSGVEFQMPKGMSSLIKISGMSKFKLILLLIISLPLIIILIPVMIVVLILKVIMFKLKN
jgi:hypothetical protein